MPEKVQFYLLDITYKVIDNRATILLFGRTPDNKQICVLDDSFEPYFYVIPKNSGKVKEKLEKVRIEHEAETYEVTKVVEVKKNFNEQEVNALKVFTRLPRDIPHIRDVIKNWDAIGSVNEFDIQFVKRYLIDKKITPLTLIEATGDFVRQKLKVSSFKAEKVEQIGDESIPSPRILAVDIETYNPAGKNIDYDKNPILMIGFYGERFRKVFTWKRFNTKEDYIEFVNGEAELIQKFKDTIEHYKPDILAGYFSDGFDLPYLDARASKYKIKLDIGLDGSEIKIRRKLETTSDILGIIHLDIFKFIRKVVSPSLKTESYNLNAVSEELLNEKKSSVDLDKLSVVWDNDPSKLEPYCEYNLNDAYLTYRLTEKMLPNITELVKIISLPIFEVIRMGLSQLVESYLLKNTSSFDEIVPNRPNYDEIGKRRQKTYQGAFVFEPKPGLYKQIVVFDFRSLYPSIISSHNISPGTLNCSCCKGKAKKAPTDNKKEEYWFCEKRKGFISSIIGELIKRRMRVKELAKNENNPMLKAREYSLKLLANSFYGYLGFFGARWYCLECAKSVTAYGRYYIHKVIDEAKKGNFEVLYSDTDSIFIILGDRKKQDALNFCEKVNLELPGLMELEYEGFYPAGIFVSAKVGRFGAKKKYALLSEEGIIKIRGFEAVRRNWSVIAKDVQEKVLKLILEKNDKEAALVYARKVINDLRQKNVPVDNVVIHTQLVKEISSYESVGPHVAIAQYMRKKGIKVAPGSIIEFVVTAGSGRIRDRVKLPSDIKENEYDADYYINNQILPSVEKIFEVLGYSKDDILALKEQKKLDKFFR